MVGIFFNILPNIITLHMPRSGRWRILVAHDFVGPFKVKDFRRAKTKVIKTKIEAKKVAR